MKKDRQYTSSGKYAPGNFSLEATTVWSFPERGSWATHNPDYRGNWSPYIPRNIILRYSSEGDYILDQFMGSGTTMIEAKLLKRRGIGFDINSSAIKAARDALRFEMNGSYEPETGLGDACNLSSVTNESIDLICTHPPYANIIRYSEDTSGDLSLFEPDEFLRRIEEAAAESFRVLKKGGCCAIMMGDTRRKRHIVPLGFRTMQAFTDAGFLIREIVVKQQHNCKTTEYWRQKSINMNFLLIAHEYLFVFRKR